MAEEKMNQKANQNIIIENRKALTISGVTDVESFNETSIVLYTELGELTVKGRDLRVNKVSIDNGDLLVEGDIGAVIYGSRDRKSTQTLLNKLFR